MKAVRFDEYGGVDVLDVREVPVPEPGPGRVLVKVKAAGINPGEAKIRDGSAARALARHVPLRAGQRLRRHRGWARPRCHGVRAGRRGDRLGGHPVKPGGVRGGRGDAT